MLISQYTTIHTQAHILTLHTVVAVPGLSSTSSPGNLLTSIESYPAAFLGNAWAQ